MMPYRVLVSCLLDLDGFLEHLLDFIYGFLDAIVSAYRLYIYIYALDTAAGLLPACRFWVGPAVLLLGAWRYLYQHLPVYGFLYT